MGQWFSTGGNCAPSGTFGGVWGYTSQRRGGAIGISSGERPEMLLNPTMHRSSPTTKNYLVRAEVEILE